MYDILMMVILVLWMVTVTWWVVRHFIGPDALYSVLGREGLDSFRASLGDNDTIHKVQSRKRLPQLDCIAGVGVAGPVE